MESEIDLMASLNIDRTHETERFGDLAEIYEIMEKGRVVKIENIDDVIPRLKGTHQNEVDLALLEIYGLSPPIREKTNNLIQIIEITNGGKQLQVVFKPFSGENASLRRNLVIDAFYKREKAAEIIDQNLGWSLVLPTVIREVEQKGIGSMQPFINLEIATPRAALAENSDMSQSQDWQKMAVFDWIIGNYDRNSWNVLHLNSNPFELIAIDHGSAWCDYPTRHPEPEKDFGPRHLLKKGRKLQPDGSVVDLPRNIPVPREILDDVREFIKRKEEINLQLKVYVTNKGELEMMWERAEEIAEKGVFL